MKTRLLLVLLVAFMSHFGASAQNILFLGNSLTYSNDLPDIVAYIADQFDESIETTSLCFPNYGLEDHWIDGRFQELMSKHDFDYVIVQQGPSSQPPGKKMLVDYGKKIKAVCGEKGATLAYFMVWPSKQYYRTFDGVIENHTYAAQVTESMLFPAGQIWRTYRKDNHKEKLYSYDQFHPAPAGSFLAALTIFHGLYPDKNLKDLKYKKCKKWVKDKDSFLNMVELIRLL